MCRPPQKCLYALLWLALPAMAGNGSADHPASYQVSPSEVRLTFFATKGDRTSVPVIAGGDFAVVDNGEILRTFRSFAPAEPTPLNIVILVDASGSVANYLRRTLTALGQELSRRETPSGDSVAVITFAGLQTNVVCVEDCGAAIARLGTLRAAGPTPLYDAVAFGAELAARRSRRNSRSVLILLSDGDDTFSKISQDEAVGSVIASGALLYSLALGKSSGAALRSMAEATGGRYFSGHETIDFVLKAALEDGRASYVVTYSLPTRATGFHSIRILPTHNPELQFHCRQGYYYDPRPR
ncbi:MAG TPA: VWA domain-containing protein [Candidatus Binatia bacterium]|nr:VWA domain-containing protein [Candidatus Binatia bacterium]